MSQRDHPCAIFEEDAIDRGWVAMCTMQTQVEDSVEDSRMCSLHARISDHHHGCCLKTVAIRHHSMHDVHIPSAKEGGPVLGGS